MTEWYDDTEPPPMIREFLDEDLDIKWSELKPGMRVRWTTPAFVRRGEIRKVQKRTMVLHLDQDPADRDTVLPDGKWYFVQGKLGNTQEHLVVINTQVPDIVSSDAVATETEDGQWVTPAQAAYITGEDAKNIRRKIRNGSYTSKRVGGRWVIARDSL